MCLSWAFVSPGLLPIKAHSSFSTSRRSQEEGRPAQWRAPLQSCLPAGPTCRGTRVPFSLFALLAPVPGWLPCLLPVWFHVRMRWPPPQHSSLYFCDCWSPLFGSSPFAGQRTNRCFIFFSGILIYRSSLMLQETLESLCLPPHCGLCPQSDRGGGSSDGVV